MAELRPCPFCGGEAEVKKVEGIWFVVNCKKCPCSVGRHWFYTADRAVAEWERRADNG